MARCGSGLDVGDQQGQAQASFDEAAEQDMTYRKQVPDERRDARAKLEALAAQGAEAEVEGSPKPPVALTGFMGRHRAGRASRKALRQLRRSCSRLAELAGVWLAVLLVPIGFFVVLAAPSQATIIWVAATWLALVIAAQVIGRVVSARAARREIEWVQGLPFQVEGYVPALQRAPVTGTNYGGGKQSTYLIPAVSKVSVEVDVGDRMESSSFAEDLLRATVPKAGLANFEPRKLSFVQKKMACNYTCYGLRRWFHTVVDELLIPLHEANTVQSVRMTTDRVDG